MITASRVIQVFVVWVSPMDAMDEVSHSSIYSFQFSETNFIGNYLTILIYIYI